MSKIKWDAAGKHFYETGVSKGVLYPMSSTTPGTYEKGVAWNGLISVSENPTGAEANAIYADNIKYLNLMSLEEFEATIEAYTYPDEFAECDGSKPLVTGFPVTVTAQERKQFALCYQTRVGNDEKQELGYKIHIIYGCLAAPSEKAYETVNDSPEAITFSWDISTTPIEIEGFRATAHIEIDSTKFTDSNKAKLTAIENKLYGTDPTTDPVSEGTEPELLLPDDIVDILNAQG